MNMDETTLTVSGMSCMGCVNSVKRLLADLPGVSQVEIDLATGRVRITHAADQVTPAAFKQAIEDGGYQVVA